MSIINLFDKYIVGIFCTVIGGFILLYLKEKYFSYQPKIKINYQTGGNSMSHVSNGSCDLTFNRKLIFKNISQEFKAYDLQIKIFSKNNPFNTINFSNCDLDPNKEIIESVQIRRRILATERETYRNHEPVEFDKFFIVLTYKNIDGRNFYLHYRKLGSKEFNKYFLSKLIILWEYLGFRDMY